MMQYTLLITVSMHVFLLPHSNYESGNKAIRYYNCITGSTYISLPYATLLVFNIDGIEHTLINAWELLSCGKRDILSVNIAGESLQFYDNCIIYIIIAYNPDIRILYTCSTKLLMNACTCDESTLC